MFIKYVCMYVGPRNNYLDDTGRFHFRDLAMTSSRSSKVKIFCGFWKSGIDFPIVFHSNQKLTSHHQEDIGDFHIRDLEMTHKGQSRSKVKMHFY